MLLAAALYFLPMVPMLWHSPETPNPGTMAWSAQTQEGKILFFCTIHNFIHALKIALDSVPHGRRYAKNTGHDRNPPKLSVGAHFELSFLGCGFLIHFLSRGSESRAVGPVGKMNKKTTP